MATPFRLLFLVRSLETGGAERQLVTLANAFAADGADITVVTYYPGGDLEASLSSHVCRLDLGKTKRWDLLGPLARYIAILRDVRPDAVHSYMDSANLLAACLRPFVPCHKLVWGIRTSDMRQGYQDAVQRLLFRLESLLSRSADLVIANSAAGLEFATSQGLHADRAVVIRNGVDTSRFTRDKAAGAALRRRLGIPAEAHTAAIVARLDPVKGHNVLIDAFAAYRDDPGHHLVIAGGGPPEMRKALEEQAWARGIGPQTHFLGNVDDPVPVYSAADIAVLSSLYGEGTPNAPAEAMACGTPCVVTDLGDSGFVVGDTGEVVPPGEPAALAAAMSRLFGRVASDPGLRERARARIEQELSIPRLKTATRKAIERLLGD